MFNRVFIPKRSCPQGMRVRSSELLLIASIWLFWGFKMPQEGWLRSHFHRQNVSPYCLMLIFPLMRIIPSGHLHRWWGHMVLFPQAEPTWWLAGSRRLPRFPLPEELLQLSSHLLIMGSLRKKKKKAFQLLWESLLLCTVKQLLQIVKPQIQSIPLCHGSAD